MNTINKVFQPNTIHSQVFFDELFVKRPKSECLISKYGFGARLNLRKGRKVYVILNMMKIRCSRKVEKCQRQTTELNSMSRTDPNTHTHTNNFIKQRNHIAEMGCEKKEWIQKHRKSWYTSIWATRTMGITNDNDTNYFKSVHCSLFSFSHKHTNNLIYFPHIPFAIYHLVGSVYNEWKKNRLKNANDNINNEFSDCTIFGEEKTHCLKAIFEYLCREQQPHRHRDYYYLFLFCSDPQSHRDPIGTSHNDKCLTDKRKHPKIRCMLDGFRMVWPVCCHQYHKLWYQARIKWWRDSGKDSWVTF